MGVGIGKHIFLFYTAGALTLLLFRPGKPGLLFDVSFILIVQITAFVYGTAIIFQERPYFAVFAVDRFQVLATRDFDMSEVDHESVGEKPFAGPQLVVAELPDDPAAFQRLLEEVLFEGKPDIDRRPEYWKAYEDGSAEVLARSNPLSELAEARPDARSAIQALSANGAGLVYVPLVGTDRDFAFVMDSDANPVGVIDVDPWLVEPPREISFVEVPSAGASETPAPRTEENSSE